MSSARRGNGSLLTTGGGELLPTGSFFLVRSFFLGNSFFGGSFLGRSFLGKSFFGRSFLSGSFFGGSFLGSSSSAGRGFPFIGLRCSGSGTTLFDSERSLGLAATLVLDEPSGVLIT